jgi:iron complex outermembrane recepter protein
MRSRSSSICFRPLLVIQIGCLLTFEASAAEQNRIGELKKLSVAELLNVTVTTVSRQDSTVGESPAAVYVITQEDIRRSGATTIPELFRRVPGMSVARVDANKWAVSARGFNDRFANKLLVQIDGRTVYSPIFSGVFWDTVDHPLEDIERIEVIRGPGASTWGANAVNGVINILTKSAAATQGGLLSGGGGSEERRFATIRYGGALRGGPAYSVYAKGFDRDESFGLSPAPFDEWSAIRGGFRTDWQAVTKHQVTLQGDYFHSDAERMDFRPQPTPPFSYTNAEHEISNGAHLLARWNRTLDGDSSWTLQGYWDRIHRRSTGEILEFTTDTFDLDFQHESTLRERHRVVWGLGYRTMDANLTDSRFNGFILAWDRHRRRLDTASAFVQDQIAIVADRLRVTLGTKLERNDLTGFEVQPSGRVLWTPTRDQSAWAAISRAVRTPTLFEDQRSVTQTPLVSPPGVTIFPRIVANPALEPEKVRAYELGYRVQATTASSVDVAAFYSVYGDLKLFAPAGATTSGAPPGTSFRLSTHQNQMRGESYGLEWSARWSPQSQWQLYGSYSLLRLNLRADASLPAMIRSTSEVAERQSPAQQAYVQSSFDLPRGTEIDVIGRFVGALAGFQVPVDNYVSMDVRVGWQPRQRMMVEIVGRDLLDDHHLEIGGSVLAGPLHHVERSVYGRVAFFWRR